jgi:hypothetical protein
LIDEGGARLDAHHCAGLDRTHRVDRSDLIDEFAQRPMAEMEHGFKFVLAIFARGDAALLLENAEVSKDA